MQLKIKLFGAMKCPKSYCIRDFLECNGMRFQWAAIARIEHALLHTGLDSLSYFRFPVLKIGEHTLYALAAECIGGKLDEGSFLGILDSGDTVKSRSIICATGVEYIRLNLANEERLLGRGFYYGAGSSEASLYHGHVFVVGGRNSAGQAALHLASRASKVTMPVRGQSLKSTLLKYLVDRIGLSSNIEVKVNCVLSRIEGGESLDKIRYRTLDTNEETEVETGWVFACVGGKPQTESTDAEQFATRWKQLSLECLLQAIFARTQSNAVQPLSARELLPLPLYIVTYPQGTEL